MRRWARVRRSAAHALAGDAAAASVCEAVLVADFMTRLPKAEIGAELLVAGYWPVGSELDCRPLLGRLVASGWGCVLPVVTDTDSALLFRCWRPGERLVPGYFSIPEPVESARTANPALVLVPLLAFDRAGHRLGQGAGFYDRTLASLRRVGSVLAVGLAFAAQEVAALPDEPHDQRLDWIVTENGAFPAQTN
ncbi:MAG: 5-formyltetrahydrofolate cyclo-ligase [Rhodospirillaceae bacterium]